jgi:hypothetical protein
VCCDRGVRGECRSHREIQSWMRTVRGIHAWSTGTYGCCWA